MGLLSSSKSTQQSNVTNTTLNTSQNLNLQDNEGVTIGENSGSITNISTDFNAIGNATDLARRSVEAAESIGRSALDLSLMQTREVANAYSDATGFVESAFDSASGYQDRALEAVAQSNRGALDVVTDTVKDLFGGVVEFVGGLQKQSQTTLGETVSSLNQIATENSKSVDQRLAESSDKMSKYMLIGVGLLAAAFVGVAVFRKG